jgi:hypothetical protein
MCVVYGAHVEVKSSEREKAKPAELIRTIEEVYPKTGCPRPSLSVGQIGQIDNRQRGRDCHTLKYFQWMLTGRLPRDVFKARPVGRRLRGRPRTRWRDYISTLAWERLGISPSELVNVAREREVMGQLLELGPPATRPRISGSDDEDKN